MTQTLQLGRCISNQQPLPLSLTRDTTPHHHKDPHNSKLYHERVHQIFPTDSPATDTPPPPKAPQSPTRGTGHSDATPNNCTTSPLLNTGPPTHLNTQPTPQNPETEPKTPREPHDHNSPSTVPNHTKNTPTKLLQKQLSVRAGRSWVVGGGWGGCSGGIGFGFLG